MKLLIAEKPLAGGHYVKLLEKTESESFVSRDGYMEGQNYCISWCLGHLVQLSMPQAYGWGRSLESLPMIPEKWQYEVIKDKSKQFKILSGLIKRAEVVINGSDAGREGELIYRLVLMMAGEVNKSQKRLWVNSFDMKDMVTGWEGMTDLSEKNNLFFASIIRQKADWLIGMNLSTGYGSATGVAGLSVGRVQTPTLGLVVKRDYEVENWMDSYYYQLMCHWSGDSGVELIFKYRREEKTRFEDPITFQGIIDECQGTEGVVEGMEETERAASPPKLYDTGDLQKVAFTSLGYSISETLGLIQKLYEKKYVTYPRTDSKYLTENMRGEAFELLDKLTTEEQKGHMQQKDGVFSFIDSSKVTDHHAIIPTGFFDGLEGLPEKEMNIYRLIKERYIMAFGKQKKWREIQLLMRCKGNVFGCKITKLVDPGYTGIFKREESDQEDVQEIEGEYDLTAGVRGVCAKLEEEKKTVTKPKHYTEASLLTGMDTAGKTVEDEDLREAMRERGLGTPITKSQIMETLYKKGYIEAKGRYLVSTLKGRSLIELVDEKVKSPEMTGEWEFQLRQIEKGEYRWQDFIKGIEAYVVGLNGSYKSEKAASFEQSVLADALQCPKCEPGRIKQTTKGWFCIQDRDKCGFVLWPSIAGKKLTSNQMEALIVKGSTGIVKGFASKAGKKFDTKLKMVDYKVSFDFGT